MAESLLLAELGDAEERTKVGAECLLRGEYELAMGNLLLALVLELRALRMKLNQPTAEDA